jgi:hypothetical protein
MFRDKCECGESAITTCSKCGNQTFCPNCNECSICTNRSKMDINLTVRINEQLEDAIDETVRDMRKSKSRSMTRSCVIRELLYMGIDKFYSGGGTNGKNR